MVWDLGEWCHFYAYVLPQDIFASHTISQFFQEIFQPTWDYDKDFSLSKAREQDKLHLHQQRSDKGWQYGGGLRMTVSWPI